MSKKSETPASRANAHKHALILLKGAMSHVAAWCSPLSLNSFKLELPWGQKSKYHQLRGI